MDTARKLQRLIAAIMVMIFAAYYCETTLFVHSHRCQGGGMMTHHHPFVPGAGHTHSSTECAFLSVAGNFVTDTPPAAVSIATAFLPLLDIIAYAPVRRNALGFHRFTSLRAPPAWL